MNVLKPHLQTTILTLLEAGTSHRQIERVTRIDRKTIRAYGQRLATERSNSPGVATGSEPQTPPPRPPAVVGPTVLHYVQAGDAWKFTFGLFITLAAAGSWGSNIYEMNELKTRRERLVDALSAMEVDWVSVTGNTDFYSIGKFDTQWRVDWEDDAFCDWWGDQRRSILDRTCGYDKGMKIGERLGMLDTNARVRRAKLQEMRAKTQSSILERDTPKA